MIGQTVLQWLFYIWSFNARVLQSPLATTFGFIKKIKTSFTPCQGPERQVLQAPWNAALGKNQRPTRPEIALTRISQQNRPSESWGELVLSADLNPFGNPSWNITAPISTYIPWRSGWWVWVAGNGCPPPIILPTSHHPATRDKSAFLQLFHRLNWEYWGEIHVNYFF